MLVDGINAKLQRLNLWEDIKRLNNSINLPWCTLGDFNNVFYADERKGGEVVHPRETENFKDCLLHTWLNDHKASGFFFTWSNSSQGNGRIQSRIDRCLINPVWSSVFSDTEVEFLPHGVLDHSPIVIKWHSFVKKATSFRYSNDWFEMPGFEDIVKEVWQEDILSDPMNRLTRKLKMLKGKLIVWSKQNCSMLHKRVDEARHELMSIQKALRNNRTNVGLAIKEKQILKKYGNLAS
ncbi:Endonuclease/exonuclease/phosphatase [Thalictrum thalictroides]|uniref:Endonuclease/exonuclease/phosphatase n=1 Tax=Thalictrum thalictroides TaxID=46969 RepID=A0A7J6X0H4_THATH|nr:Endonuclease/exonuclease/phosphatase [Thalictrum thalictroides]